MLRGCEAKHRPDYKAEPILYKNALPQRKETVATKTPAVQKKLDTKQQEVAKGKTSDSRRQREELQDEKEDTDDADHKDSEQEIADMFPLEVSEGTKQLDALTARMLDYELRHIMIKVWQEFPDDPATDEEKFVVEKFRNEAGDDLRNVIGLNVTKRLLNVHNRLIVKVRFSNRPEKGYLLAFLKKYRIRGFKRVSAETNTFAAQLKTIEDFDRICAEKEISCGTAKLTITPCYKFMKRPPNLKTKFVDDADDDITDESKGTKESFESKQGSDLKKKTDMKDDSDNKQNENTSKSVRETTSLQEKKNSEDSKQQSVKTDSTKPDEGTNKKPTNVSNSQVNDKSSSVAKVTATKTSTAVSNLPNEKKLVQSKVTKIVDKPSTVKNNENKAAITKTTQNAPQTEQKQLKSETTIKATDSSKSVQKVQVPKVVKKPEIKSNENKNVVQSTPKTPLKKLPPKTVQKTPVPKTQTKTNSNQVKGKNAEFKASKENKSIKKDIKKAVIDKYDDYDEMDDEDILALLSEGVVLDECGSDEE